MAVHLPSDLVSDVMLNADPVRRRAAVARLESAAATPAADFASEVDDAGRRTVQLSSWSGSEPSVGHLSSAPGAIQTPSARTPASEGFEQMVLRNLFETLLPDDTSGSFGGGPSAGIWRSMAADQLAGVVARGGGIGIADMLDGSMRETGPKRTDQWPYFALDSITTIRG